MDSRSAPVSAPLVSILLLRTAQCGCDEPRRPRYGIGAFLDAETEIEGRYACSGTVVLNGKFRGEIHAKDTLIIGEGGSVQASIVARSLIVHGDLVGNVMASERVELRGAARVSGDIDAPVIVMEEGVLLEGQCRMGKANPEEPDSSNVVALAR